jgi:sulfur carrier protein
MAFQIMLNGKPDEVAEGTSLAALLEAKGVSSRLVAVELNRRILSRDEFGATQLRTGDVVEVVTFVGGG